MENKKPNNPSESNTEGTGLLQVFESSGVPITPEMRKPIRIGRPQRRTSDFEDSMDGVSPSLPGSEKETGENKSTK